MFVRFSMFFYAVSMLLIMYAVHSYASFLPTLFQLAEATKIDFTICAINSAEAICFVKHFVWPQKKNASERYNFNRFCFILMRKMLDFLGKSSNARELREE